MIRLLRIVAGFAVLLWPAMPASGATLTVSPSTLPPATAGFAYGPVQLMATGGNGQYTWSLQDYSCSWPPSLSSSGQLSGNPPAADAGRSCTIFVSVSDNAGDAGDGQLGLQMNPPPTVTTTSVPSGTAGSSYPAFQFTYTGGSPPVAWSAFGLPSGMTISPGGVLGGPLAANSAGTYTITVAVTDTWRAQARRQYMLTISSPPLAITTMAVPSGTAGSSYPAFTFTATGGVPPYTWSETGALPAVMNFSSGGVLSGTPAANSAGNYPLTVKVTDSQGTQASMQYALIINPPPLTITTTSVPAGAAGSSFPAFTFTATGGTPPYTWSITGQPPGMNIGAATGTLSGTPAANSAGNYSLTVKVADSQGMMATRQYTLVIAAPPVFITTMLPNSEVGANFSQNIQVSGGTPPYTFSAPSPPPGLAMTQSGTLAGVPTAAGTFMFMVIVVDSAGGQATHSYMETIAPPVANTTLSLSNGVAGASYSQTIVATGGIPPYNFAIVNTTAAGLTLNSSTGVLSGTPTAPGTFTLVVVITDSLNVPTPPAQYSLTINPAGAALQVSTQTLSFTSAGGVDLPPGQAIAITSTMGNTVNYLIQRDNGTSGAAPPVWLKLGRLGGSTPDLLPVGIDPNAPPQPAGSQTARIRVLVAGDDTQPPIDIMVTYTVVAAAPQLGVLPGFLRFAARVQAPGTLEQDLALQYLGGTGTLGFSASIIGIGSSVVSVSPASGQIAPNSPVFLFVDVNTTGLPVGPQRFVVRITTMLGSVDVPVLLFVADAGPILALSQTGVQLIEGAGGAPLAPQTVQVFNFGDPGTIINWTATLRSGAGAVSFAGGASGTATGTQPGTLTVAASNNVTNGSAALVEVTAPNVLNSPQYLAVVVNRAPPSAGPQFQLVPAGLVLTPASAQQTVRVYTDSPTPVPFQAATDAPTLVSFSPSSGMASAKTPGQIAVSANGSGAAGLSIAVGAVVQTVNVRSIMPQAGTTPASAIRAAAGCSPSHLLLTHTGMPNNFSVPAGWPATLIVQLNDDCAAPVLNGSVVANFSNGDPPLSLTGDRLTGTYSATWQPGKVASSMTVTAYATAGTLAPASAQLIGGVNPNSVPTPVLTRNGTLNNSNPVTGAALAPGTVAQVFGSGLASQTVSPGVVPLPTNFNGTDMLVGGLDAPLYFLSDGQLDVQIPFELAPNRQYQAIVIANGALTLPDTIDMAPVSPGVTAFPDGTLIAQHADFSLVDANHPAKPGETLTMYLAGMGATNPAVATDQQAPGGPFAQAAAQPTVTVGGQNAAISFAGLTPGGIGLYQINFQVPPSTGSGNLDVVVTQNGVAANTTKLPVAP